jgi:hypothetical protein
MAQHITENNITHANNVLYCSLKYGDFAGLMMHVNGGFNIIGIRQETMVVSDIYLMIYNIVFHCSLKYRDSVGRMGHVTDGSDMMGIRQELMMMTSNILGDL